MPVKSSSDFSKTIQAIKAEHDHLLAELDLERHRLRENCADDWAMVERSRELVTRSRELLAEIDKLFPTSLPLAGKDRP